MTKVIAIIGTRPHFIKHFSLERASRAEIELITVHTGQHYDTKMSAVFFDQLGMSKPKYLLNTSSENHSDQKGKMMTGIEKIAIQEKPDLMIVYGDTNSTLAGALVASKLGIPIAHVEAGLRSYNKKMPEEVNRVMTDQLSRWLFCPSQNSAKNLEKEGIVKGVTVIGDLMKDIIKYVIDNNKMILPEEEDEYYYVTLHRPYNVDEKIRLKNILESINSLPKKCIFAIHPRTRINMKKFGIEESLFSNIDFIDPQSYFENLGYIHASSGLITDSGGMQKEAYWLKKKCITVRSETEWVETLKNQCNELVFEDLSELRKISNTSNITFDDSLYGDGLAAKQIVNTIP